MQTQGRAWMSTGMYVHWCSLDTLLCTVSCSDTNTHTYMYVHIHLNTYTPTCMQQLSIFHHGNHSSCCFRPCSGPPTRGSWSTYWCFCNPLLKRGRVVIFWILNPFAEWVVNWVWKPHFQTLRRWRGAPGIHRSHTHVVELYSHMCEQWYQAGAPLPFWAPGNEAIGMEWRKQQNTI